jgi:hypothetical protein
MSDPLVEILDLDGPVNAIFLGMRGKEDARHVSVRLSQVVLSVIESSEVIIEGSFPVGGKRM